MNNNDTAANAGMSFDEYQAQALRSETPLQRVFTDANLLRYSLIAAEAMGDYIDQIKKVVVYGKEIDYTVLRAKLRTLDLAVCDLSAHTAVRGDAPSDVAVHPRLLHAALGLYGESGEIFAALLHQMNGEALDVKNLEEEIGDVSWYVALYMDAMHTLGAVSMVSIWAMNIAKLKARFPAKFSLAASDGRNVEREREAMEKARVAA